MVSRNEPSLANGSLISIFFVLLGALAATGSASVGGALVLGSLSTTPNRTQRFINLVVRGQSHLGRSKKKRNCS